MESPIYLMWNWNQLLLFCVLSFWVIDWCSWRCSFEDVCLTYKPVSWPCTYQNFIYQPNVVFHSLRSDWWLQLTMQKALASCSSVKGDVGRCGVQIESLITAIKNTEALISCSCNGVVVDLWFQVTYPSPISSESGLSNIPIRPSSGRWLYGTDALGARTSRSQAKRRGKVHSHSISRPCVNRIPFRIVANRCWRCKSKVVEISCYKISWEVRQVCASGVVQSSMDRCSWKWSQPSIFTRK